MNCGVLVSYVEERFFDCVTGRPARAGRKGKSGHSAQNDVKGRSNGNGARLPGEQRRDTKTVKGGRYEGKTGE